MSRVALLMPLLILLGCASLDDTSRLALDNAEALLESEPERSLRQALSVLESYPDNIEAHRLAAIALENLQRYDDATQEWEYLISQEDRLETESFLEAHAGVIRNVVAQLGDLPHRVAEPPQGALRARIVKAFNSCDTILEYEPADRFAQYSKAALLYRMGLPHRARPILTEIVGSEPNNAAARFVLNLVREQQIGVHDRAIREFCSLVRCDDPDIQRQAAQHLIYLLDDPKLDEGTKDNISGNLLRFANNPKGVPTEVLAWSQRYSELSSHRIEERRQSRVLQEIEAAQELRDWERGWRLLTELSGNDPELKRRRVRFAELWCQELLSASEQLLERGQVQEAKQRAEMIAKLPTDHFPESLKGRIHGFTSKLDTALAANALQATIEQVHAAIAKRDGAKALTLLEGIESAKAPRELRGRLDTLRAEALYLTGDKNTALQLLDAQEELEDPRHQRIYGILLTDARRSEEAQQVLESLPYGHLTGKALESLLMSLEQQKKWEEILGRLLSIHPLPEQYRVIRRNACYEAANIRLRRKDPRGALQVLDTYLDETEMTRPPVHEIYLGGLLATSQTDRASEIIETFGIDNLLPLSTDLMDQIAQKIAPDLPGQQRFRLLSTLEAQEDGITGDLLDNLWAEFGHYLPKPGSYSIRYRSVQMGSGTNQEPTYLTQTLRWERNEFVVAGEKAPKERWREKSGVWMRQTSLGEMRIPVRAVGSPPHAPLSYRMQNTDWTAEIVETNNLVSIDGQNYRGCIRVRLVPDGETEESIYLDLAPRIGEIRREVYSAGELQFVRELISFNQS